MGKNWKEENSDRNLCLSSSSPGSVICHLPLLSHFFLSVLSFFLGLPIEEQDREREKKLKESERQKEKRGNLQMSFSAHKKREGVEKSSNGNENERQRQKKSGNKVINSCVL